MQNFPNVQGFPQARRSFENLFEASTPEILIDHNCMISSRFENSPVRAGAHRVFLCRLLSMTSSGHFKISNVLYPRTATKVV